MIVYLVTELEVSRRAVTAQDLRQLKKWAHNHSAVLRCAAQAGSSTSPVFLLKAARPRLFGAPRRGREPQLWLPQSKRFRLSAFLCGSVEDHTFLIRMGLRRRGISLLQVAVPPFRILARQPHRPGLLPYRGWILPCRLLQSKLRLALVLLLSRILPRLYGKAAWRPLGATDRWVGALSCRPRLFSLRRSLNLIPPLLLLSIAPPSRSVDLILPVLLLSIALQR